MIILSQQ